MAELPEFQVELGVPKHVLLGITNTSATARRLISCSQLRAVDGIQVERSTDGTEIPGRRSIFSGSSTMSVKITVHVKAWGILRTLVVCEFGKFGYFFEVFA